MKCCNQSSNQNVYEHGISVRDKLFELINNKNLGQWKIPNWFYEYKNKLLENLYTWDILEEYTLFHDCGKFYCLIIDEQGKQHFPNHANVSADKYLEINNNKIIVDLIRNDMIIHTIKLIDVDNFCKNSQMASNLLLTGLSEIHANAQLFGGIESVNFKIKWKNINKLGKTICKKLYV